MIYHFRLIFDIEWRKKSLDIYTLSRNIANYQGLSLEGTDYDDFNVEPNQIHKGKNDHIWAFKLLSDELSEQLENAEKGPNDFPRIRWERYRPEEDVVAECGDVKIIEDSEYILNVGEDYFGIGKSAEKKWGLLRDLAREIDTKRAIKNNYEANHSLNALNLEGLKKHLENGNEEDLSDEILSVLERFPNQHEEAKA